jgi:multicomponent Na+:H+ antiporter subunit E
MVRNYIYVFLVSLGVWLCLCSSLHGDELIAGVVVSLIVLAIFGRSFNKFNLPPLSLKRTWYCILYCAELGQEIVKANFDVAYRILHPSMPIKPGIVAITTTLKSNLAKCILANSITLTPGTFTVDVIGDTLLIHWIYVKTESTEGATKRIGEKFEKYLRVIFE